MTESRLRERNTSLLDVISELFQGEGLRFELPSGVEKVERVTCEAVRINFLDEIDYDLLSRIAAEEGCVIEAEGFTPRVIDEGTILMRVGSKSDPGGRHDIFVYLFPSVVEQMNSYVKSIAVLKKVLDPETEMINLERFYECNLKVIRVVEKYRRGKYQSLKKRLKL